MGRLIAPRLCLLAVGLLCAMSARSQERTLWQIGTFDASSGEFRSQGIDYSDPKSDPVYRIGQSQESTDWPRFQPGPANGMAGGRLHPFTILFALAEKPAGSYRLEVAILYETPRLSHLRVEVNGHAGEFYFQPKLNYQAGDWEGTFVPQTSTATKVINIPASWLKEGENRFVLTALDAPNAVENSLGSIALGHTGIVYDALRLTYSAEKHKSVLRPDTAITPTIFYRKNAESLAEIVEAVLNFSSMPKKAEAELRIAGKSLHQTFTSANEFGEVRLEFAVPEWKGTQPAILQLSSPAGTTKLARQLTPAKKWIVSIVPQEHLDIGFTDYPDKIAELHSQSVDSVLELLPSRPEFRWTLDGSWVAEQYLAGRSPQRQAEFLQSVRDRKITLPMQYANQHTGVASLEGLARSLYSSRALAEKYSLPIGAAHITDVPSYSWSYASVLHDAGVKYFAAASNSWRAPVVLQGRWNEKSPFYWEGPDGGRVLMWYSRAYLQLATLFGTPQRLEAVKDALPVFLQAYSRSDYQADSVIVFGSQLENTALNTEQADLVRNWQAQFEYPRLEYSDFADAMAHIEKQFDGKIAVFRGDFGPYWEDGFTSDSFHTAIHRQNQQRILSAEKFGAISSVLDSSIRPDEGLLASAWKNMLLFDEHTWTFVGATTQPDNFQTTKQLELKRGEAIAAREAIERSINRDWAQFEAFLGPKDTSLAVFNSVNWVRDGFVEADLADGLGIFDPATNQEIPVETLAAGRTTPLPGFGGPYRRVRFLAEEVPALGYKLFALRQVSQTPPRRTEPGDAGTTKFENDFYRVTVDPESGGISNIWDKNLQRELVDTSSPYRFGAYVYVTGADDMPNNSLYRYGASLKPPSLQPVAAKGGKLISVHRSPYGTVIILESSAPHTPLIRTEITLPDKEKRIMLSYTVRKEPVLSKEAVYIAFPFQVAGPQFAYETQTGWVNPAKDELPGGSREWYAVNHWAAVFGDGVSAAIVPHDAPLVNFGDIVRGNWPLQFVPSTSTIFSCLMSNYWGTNFAPQQGGEFTFRYDIVSQPAFEPVQLSRMGLNAMTPLESDIVNATFTPGRLPATSSSLLEIDNDNVALGAWKRAERGEGTILRLLDLSGKPQAVRIHSPFFKIDEAWNCTLLEDKKDTLPLSGQEIEVTLQPFEIKTIFIRATSTLSPPATLPAGRGSQR